MQYEGSDRDVAPPCRFENHRRFEFGAAHPHLVPPSVALCDSSHNLLYMRVRWGGGVHLAVRLTPQAAPAKPDKAKDSGRQHTQNPSPCLNCPSGRSDLGGDEPLLKIRQDVIDVLDADSQSHQSRSHSGGQLVLRREL